MWRPSAGAPNPNGQKRGGGGGKGGYKCIAGREAGTCGRLCLFGPFRPHRPRGTPPAAICNAFTTVPTRIQMMMKLVPGTILMEGVGSPVPIPVNCASWRICSVQWRTPSWTGCARAAPQRGWKGVTSDQSEGYGVLEPPRARIRIGLLCRCSVGVYP